MESFYFLTLQIDLLKFSSYCLTLPMEMRALNANLLPLPLRGFMRKLLNISTYQTMKLIFSLKYSLKLIIQF